jgi:RNA polymerase sigma factor (sigma-70 family)
MRVQRSWTLQKLSVAACAVAAAAMLGGSHAAEQAEGLTGIQRYCATSWRNAGIDAQDWDDCTQEVMAQLLERLDGRRMTIAIGDEKSEERRELNRSIWCVAQRWRRRLKPASMDQLASFEQAAEEVDRDLADEADQVWMVAAGCLTSRQQQILSLWSQGWTIREIAGRLDLSPARASDEKYKAIKKLRKRLGIAEEPLRRVG